MKDIVVSRPHQRLRDGTYNTLITIAYISTGKTFEKLWSFTVKTPYSYPTLFKYSSKEYPLVIGINGTIYKLNGDGTLEEFLNVPYSSYKWCRFLSGDGTRQRKRERGTQSS